jgi:thioredoxin 2
MAGQLDNRGILVNCPSCGKTNRLAYGTLGKNTRCGECTATLAPPDVPIDVPSDEAFVALIRASALPVVVDFWAPWCGPCRIVAPELEKVARNAAGEMVVAKVNTDALQDVGMRFSIRSIPTMAVFRDGREIGRTSGARPANDILAFVRQSLQAAHA